MYREIIVIIKQGQELLGVSPHQYNVATNSNKRE